MIEILRKPSEIPNITNTDDFVNLRYAYANQNGYIKNRGAEVSATINGNNLTINSGRLVVQGVECDIDANGETISIDAVSTKRYYIIYLQVNLALNTATILSSNDTLGYPNIESGDDLTANTTGIANLVLYQFTAENGIISDLTKIVKAIEYPLVFNVDNNGVFKIGDIVIPQRKMLFKGNIDIGSVKSVNIMSLNYEDITGKTFEFIGSNNILGDFVFDKKIKVIKDRAEVSFILDSGYDDSNNFYKSILEIYLDNTDLIMRYYTSRYNLETKKTTNESGINLELNEVYEIIE